MTLWTTGIINISLYEYTLASAFLVKAVGFGPVDHDVNHNIDLFRELRLARFPFEQFLGGYGAPVKPKLADPLPLNRLIIRGIYGWLRPNI